MYNKRALVANTGVIVESYSYDPYGRPLIRECAGAGDMTGNSVVDSEDWDRFVDAYNCDIFDPRADIDGDGVVSFPDDALFDVKAGIWDGSGPSPVRMARSLVGNPYMFQGRPNFVFDTDMSGEAADAELTLNDHRNRFADQMTGRWLTRDPIGYADSNNLYELLVSNPTRHADSDGLSIICDALKGACLLGADILKKLCRADCEVEYGPSINGNHPAWKEILDCYRGCSDSNLDRENRCFDAKAACERDIECRIQRRRIREAEKPQTWPHSMTSPEDCERNIATLKAQLAALQKQLDDFKTFWKAEAANWAGPAGGLEKLKDGEAGFHFGMSIREQIVLNDFNRTKKQLAKAKKYCKEKFGK